MLMEALRSFKDLEKNSTDDGKVYLKFDFDNGWSCV